MPVPRRHARWQQLGAQNLAEIGATMAARRIDLRTFAMTGELAVADRAVAARRADRGGRGGPALATR